jgi:hypothetical protein
MLKIRTKPDTEVFAPLEDVTVECDGDGTLCIRDGQGRTYFRAAAGGEVTFRVGGALGTHTVFREDGAGRVAEEAAFVVDCRTAIDDEGGRYRRLLDMLYFTLMTWGENDAMSRVDGKYYSYYVRWIRDHVHTLKGKKYFDGDHKSAIELYADYQQPNGMIWDRIAPATPEQTWRDYTFAKGNFIESVENGTKRFERIPVENDVEFLFLEGLYYTWKATGDDLWMSQYLDHAIRACEYSTSDPYRWSEKFQLLKRGYTIDTWDFMTSFDTALTLGGNVVDLERTTFGVMHGDNTGFAQGCLYLAEMLEVAGRSDEAGKYRDLGQQIKQRLDEVAWNGEFYTHHVTEDPSFVRDLGVDESTQVSLSNAYALNRCLTHEQCVAIIKTYQRIREEMPASSPGEFYQIYPPFERGFGDHNAKWHYMNGGVGTIVAGELAHGAFEHGFEAYGADILDRVLQWGDAHDGYLDCCYRGCAPEIATPTFTTLDLRTQANTDLAVNAERDPGVMGWTNEGINDISAIPTGKQRFLDIDFEVIDPASNARRACIGLSNREGYAREAAVLVRKKAQSIYFLHTMRGGGLAGWFTIEYADGSKHVEYVMPGRHLGNWFMPSDPVQAGHTVRSYAIHHRVAWRGETATFKNVGVHAYGMDNPRPDTEIREIRFTAAENGNQWFVLGVTLSDQAFLFPTGDVSFGIPDCWGSAAVVYAVLEGLAGAKDQGRAFDKPLLAPRWSAAGVSKASATVKYEASGGYVSYRYAQDDGSHTLRLTVTGNTDDMDLRVLLPNGAVCQSARLDNQDADVETTSVEGSSYACVKVGGVGAHEVELKLEAS